MLIEVLSNLASLNLGYFISLITGNLFWIFGFVSASYYFRGKNFWMRFFTIIFVVCGLMDIQKVYNLRFYVGGALLLLCLGRIVVLTTVAKTKGGEKYMPLFYALTTYSVLFYFNFFA